MKNKKLVLLLVMCFIQLISHAQNRDSYTKVQKKYQNKIVFSNSKIVKNEENPQEFVTTWNMGDVLYERIYMEKTPMEYLEDFRKETKLENQILKMREVLVVKINGKEVTTFDVNVEGKFIDFMVSRSGLVFKPELNNANNPGLAIEKAFRELGDELKPGNFKVELQAYVMNATSNEKLESSRVVPTYSGTLNVNVTEEGLEKYKILLCVGKKEGTTDVELESQIMSSFDNFKVKAGKSTKCHVYNSEWKIKKHEKTGRILYRYKSCRVWYIDNEGKGKRRRFNAKQDYDGANYSKTVILIDGKAEEPASIHCLYD